MRNPVYSRERSTLSYDARRLKPAQLSRSHSRVRPFVGRLDTALPNRFGRAAVFIDGSGNTCEGSLSASLSGDKRASVVSSSKWDTDDWDQEPKVDDKKDVQWKTSGGIFRGCGNSVLVQFSAPFDKVQVLVQLTDPFSGDNIVKCSTDSNNYKCGYIGGNTVGDALRAVVGVCRNGEISGYCSTIPDKR